MTIARPWLIFSGRMAAFAVVLLLIVHCSYVLQRQALSYAMTITGASAQTFFLFLRTGTITDTHRSSVNARSSPTVIVNVYVESLCIDSKAYFDEQLRPTYETLGPTVMNLRVVVFGNAHIETNSTKIQCQHGEAECDANSFEQCAADVYHNYPGRYVPFVACLFDRLKMGHSDALFPASQFASCAAATALSWSAIKECHDDDKRSWDLQKRAAAETPADHTGVPWVVLNGGHVDEEGDLLMQVCELYTAKGGSHPACS